MHLILFIILMLFASVETTGNRAPMCSADRIYEVEQRAEQHQQLQQYERFSEKLALLESSGRLHITSAGGGYLGKYQFGELALQDINLDVPEAEFLSSEELQERALFEYLKVNRRYLDKEIQQFAGKTINGIHLTEPALLAAAHLAGAANVKKWLYSGGEQVFKDGNGTPVTRYLRIFSRHSFSITTQSIASKATNYAKDYYS